MTSNNWTKDQQYLSFVSDLLDRPEVQKLNNYKQHHATTRLNHCVSVSYKSYLIAKKLGLNAKAVARAGLLHDLFYYDWRTTKFMEGSHAWVHPQMAYQNALKLTDLSDLEKDIIVKHMWLATLALPRYKESYVVTCVDKYCAISEYSSGKAESFKQFLKSIPQRLSLNHY